MIKIRVLIVDDHKILREGLKRLFERTSDIVVVGEAADGGQTLATLRTTEVDLVLLDISIPGSTGDELISRIHAHHPALPILMLTMHKEVQIATRKLKAGAAGYITKDSDPEVLISAVRKVAAGRHYIPPDLAEQIAFEAFTPSGDALHEQLSDRERQILGMIGAGKSVNEVALLLSISAKTVSTHKFRLMKKLRIDNNSKLIHYAISNGLIE